MKLEVLMLVSAFALAFVHPDAAQVAATAVLVLLVTRIERERKNKKRAQQIAEARGRRGN
jgi:Flp pilus assembly protein TadB